MPLIIGLTGGIGCGKSTATKYFAAHGIDIIDTDEIAHELTLPGGKAMSLIKKTFGTIFISKDGSLDRGKMRELVFSNPIFKNKLEAILHPLIYQEVVRRIRLATSAYILIIVPLLLEAKAFHELVHRILVIDCTEQLQISRTIARSKLDEQEIHAIMATQVSRKERLTQADDIIINDQDLDHLHKQIEILHLKYLALSRNKLNKPV
ncbi:dephospho-CoA kinase [Nitrosomonas communis]|uniref:Dephospho-CoA kinase n=1 Tax=Nitrosomonas communis TaxID=44574 RepID=A0A1I4IU33_9PROT|nr:dephospho-CoA kinase [Nitrosomonas communis]SFL57858.1 dephospho-CoA kinase [Nitrosomonas communis]